jgi:hypothetical protein
MDCDFNMLCELDDRAQDVLITRALRHDDGSAAQEHLRSGRPIYYCEDDVDEDGIVREWPDGTREIVDIDDQGHIALSPVLA